MDTSVDKFYAKVFGAGREMPEWVLGKIAFSVVSALHYLHTQLKVSWLVPLTVVYAFLQSVVQKLKQQTVLGDPPRREAVQHISLH